MIYRNSEPLSTIAASTDGLARAIARFAQSDGDYATAIPALSLHRRKGPTEPLHCIFNLGLGVVAQGNKQALVGEEVVNYGPGQSMLTSIDLPVISHVTRGSTEEPMLGLMLTLDSRQIVKTAAEMQLPAPPRTSAFAPITIETLDGAMIGVLIRLIELLDQPALAPHLAPLYQHEILVRLLVGPHRTQLQHLAANGSPSQQIARAVAWLKQNFSNELRVDDLAAHAHMSPSTFRQHFRNITGTSPLQYQKQLRLQEARQLMLSLGVDAGSAAVQVGYESASQFSREYSRLFGAPPQQDVRRLRLS
ncbi:AraC family transcriptional regulator [Paraburkholderia hospita]|uniref:AraC family transcriptional regulator n=1 Tax=Paraburkholderia hospita TaxID=169430 RepID=A0ABN0F9I4_9BURK|nr:AraC family transcriptional regulator [Paraburkholderia hospita]EIM95302.1 AraC family transcriptional regulator [Paraburkholderia hospita]OUL84668.1 AraC family transcriptional regulator [Paraburkholderia hospita]SKD06527.1 transcriptional regulator, AraC family [Paraburkholderia hospita]